MSEEVKAPWKKDGESTACDHCGRAFTFFRRRHHCRRCGDIFCGDCCCDKVKGVAGYGDKSQRICKKCNTVHFVTPGQGHANTQKQQTLPLHPPTMTRQAPPAVQQQTQRRNAGDRFSAAPASKDTQSSKVLQFIVTTATPTTSMEQWLRGSDPAVLLEGCVYAEIEFLIEHIQQHLTKPDVSALVRQCGLNQDEAFAVTLYTEDCPGVFAAANRMLRVGDEAGVQLYQPFLQWLFTGLSKLPSYDGLAFRVGPTKDITTEYIVGAEIIWSQFSSCSMELSEGQLSVFGKNVDAVLSLEVRGARKLGALSVFPNESEVVLLPPWRGQVVGSLNSSSKASIPRDVFGVDLGPFTVLELVAAGVPPGGVTVQHLVKRLQRQLQANPNDAIVHSKLARVMKDHFKDFEGAKQHYDTALKINPNHGDAHNNLATLMMQHFKDFEGAKQHYETALKINPNHGNAHNNLALLMKNHFKDFEGAKQHFETALKINPNNDAAHNNLARVMVDHFKDFEGAKQHFETALKINPNHVGARKGLDSLIKLMA